MINLIVVLITIVIIDPYRYLNYENPTVYVINKKEPFTINTYEGNSCLERYGCYENKENIEKPKVIYIPMTIPDYFNFNANSSFEN